MAGYAKAGKPDANQAQIVAGLEALGCRVQLLSGVGGGCPDLLVGTPAPRRLLLLLEVKNPARAKSQQKLRDNQQAWHQRWALYPVATVTSFEQARDIVLEYCGRKVTTAEAVPDLSRQLETARSVED